MLAVQVQTIQRTAVAQKFQTCTEAASKEHFRRPFQAMHPSPDKFGSFSWPSREEIESLLVLS